MVRKNKSEVLFQDISFTSKLNCSSTTLYDLVSINETRSSLLPTAIVFPLGDHAILIFSPFVGIVATHLCVLKQNRMSQFKPPWVLFLIHSPQVEHLVSTDFHSTFEMLSPMWQQNVIYIEVSSMSSILDAVDLVYF